MRHRDVSLEKVGCFGLKHVRVLHLCLLFPHLSWTGLQDVFGSGSVHLLGSKPVSEAWH